MRRHRLVTTAAALVVTAWIAPACAESPEATVRRVTSALAEQRPVVLWDALPRSYQRQATSLVHDFAAAVDPTVHARAVAVGRKGVTVLRAQRDLILSSRLASGFATEGVRAEKGWDALVGILDTLLRSELADLDELRTVDPAAFLRTTGSRVMGLAAVASSASADDPYANAFVAGLQQLEVEVMDSSADAATVRVTTAGRPSRDLSLVRVEGRWVPRDLASSWPDMVTDARAQIAALRSPESSRQRTQMMMGLGLVEGLVNRVAAMKTPDELDAAFQGLLGGTSSGPTPSTPAE